MNLGIGIGLTYQGGVFTDDGLLEFSEILGGLRSLPSVSASKRPKSVGCIRTATDTWLFLYR